jgi:hypothetical protein
MDVGSFFDPDLRTGRNIALFPRRSKNCNTAVMVLSLNLISVDERGNQEPRTYFCGGINSRLSAGYNPRRCALPLGVKRSTASGYCQIFPQPLTFGSTVIAHRFSSHSGM